MRRLPHPSITEDRITALCIRQLTTTDNPGVCLACGNDQDGTEPDAENYTCDECGESCVMGAQQILIAGAYHPDKPSGGTAEPAKPADWSNTTQRIDIDDET